MNRFDLLLYKFKSQTCTSTELEELLGYLASGEHEPALKAAIERQLLELPDDAEPVEEQTEQILKQINLQIDRSSRATLFSRYWWLAAASVLILGTLGIWNYTKQKTPAVAIVKNSEPLPVIVPGGNRAILTLANGKAISLTDAANGTLARDGGVSVNKTRDGELQYSSENDGKDYARGVNTLRVPKGGTYDIMLTDGTHVWLNSGSSLTFPTAFGPERQVVLSGEGYFEVARNGKPFKVQTATQTVQVLGTHFNVEAYPDEQAVKTTLLEGSVKVLKDKESVLLTPGQMGINKTNSRLYTVKADLDEVMDWKNGLFVFDNETIAEVMRKAARWYDVEVTFENGIEQKKLMGTVSRYKSINELLDNIALAGKLRYKIEGRRVVLMK